MSEMRPLLLALAAALVLCSLAAAHGGPTGPRPGLPGFKTTITQLEPSIPGVAVQVLGSDDRLRLRNRGRRKLLILGYGGEPYLRFEPSGVYRNENSPNTYLDLDRFATGTVPDYATPAIARRQPAWSHVSLETVWEWHDHRIHWRRQTPLPAPVRRAPDETHRIFAWAIPGRVDGKPLSIRGRLDYAPPPAAESGAGGRSLLIGGVVAVTLLVGLGGWLALRRLHRQTAES